MSWPAPVFKKWHIGDNSYHLCWLILSYLYPNNHLPICISNFGFFFKLYWTPHFFRLLSSKYKNRFAALTKSHVLSAQAGEGNWSWPLSCSCRPQVGHMVLNLDTEAHAPPQLFAPKRLDFNWKNSPSAPVMSKLYEFIVLVCFYSW